MAVPKYKTSKSKTRSRLAQWTQMEEPSLSECTNCGSAREPHQVCMDCGYYNGEKILNESELST